MNLDKINNVILKGLSGQAREDFINGLKKLDMANPDDREALRESIKRSRPDFTPEQIEIFMNPQAASSENTFWE